MTVIDKIERPPVLRRDAPTRTLRMSAAGVGGILLDPSDGAFDLGVQERLFGLDAQLRGAQMRSKGIHQAVLGMNNLLVMFDPLVVEPARVRDMLALLWGTCEPMRIKGRTVEFDVVYGGEHGPDLEPTAEALGLSVGELVRQHSEAEYNVAAIGSMPGFPYMAGLPERLHINRRSVPRLSLQAGSVIVGGAQASVLPMTAPCGWHALGRTETPMFDPSAERPSLLAPGDIVRFNVCKVLS